MNQKREVIMKVEVGLILDRIVLWTKMHASAVLSVAYAVILAGLSLAVIAGESPQGYILLSVIVLHVVMAAARFKFVVGSFKDIYCREVGVFFYVLLYGSATCIVLMAVHENIFFGAILGGLVAVYWPKILEKM